MCRIIVCSAFFMVAQVSTPALARQVVLEIEQRPVGAGVVAATTGSPLDFADALSDAGFAVGVHLRSNKWQALRFQKRVEPNSGLAVATLAQAITAFRLSHPGWSVDLSATGLVIRDLGIEPRGDVVPEFITSNTDVRSAFSAAERAIVPSMPVLGGMVSSRISDPEAVSTLRPEPVLVSVHLAQASLEEILNAIAAQAPGTGWVLVRYLSGASVSDRLSVRYPGNLRSESAWSLPVPSKR